MLFTSGARAAIHVAVTDDLVGRGIKAGDIANAIAAIVGGKGGGRPDNARGGGKDASKLDEAMAQMKLEHIDRATYRIALADGVVRRMDRTAVVKAHDMENKTVVTMTLSPAR